MRKRLTLALAAAALAAAMLPGVAAAQPTFASCPLLDSDQGTVLIIPVQIVEVLVVHGLISDCTIVPE